MGPCAQGTSVGQGGGREGRAVAVQKVASAFPGEEMCSLYPLETRWGAL